MAGILSKVRNAYRAAKRSLQSSNLEPVDTSSGGREWRTIFDWRPGGWQQDDPFLGEGERIDIMGTAVVYACIRLLAWDIAKLPAKVCRLVAGVWTELSHQVLTPLIRRPNYYQGWIDFILSWLYSYLIAGNAYIVIVRDGGRVTQLIPLDPALVQPMVDRLTGAIVYRVGHDPLTPISVEDTLVPASEIIHHRYMAFGHPLIGTSLLVRAQTAAKMRQGILTANAELATNNGVPPGVLIAPEGLSPEQLAVIQEKWNARKAGKIPVMDAAFRFESLQAKFIDSQSKEFADVSGVDICVATGVPAWKLGLGQRPSGNVETLQIIYYQDSLQLPIEHVEQLLDLGLEVADDVYICIDRKELFLLDSKTRAEVHAGLVKGIMAPNEARLEWNLPAVPGGESVYMQQQNFSLEALAARDKAAPAPSAGAASPAVPETGAEPDDDMTDDPATDDGPQAAVLPWSGVYSASRDYRAGCFVTHKGSLWARSAKPGSAEPGTDPAMWKLAAKGSRVREVVITPGAV